MKNSNLKLLMKFKILFFLLLSSFLCYSQSTPFFKAKTELRTQPSYATGIRLQFTAPDSAASYFKKNIEHNLKKKDTLKALLGITELSNLYTNITKYEEAYDGYWRALNLLDHFKNKEAEAYIFESMVWVYSLYERWDIAFDYAQKALQIKKELLKQSVISDEQLIHSYYQMAVVTKEKGEYGKALNYLDSVKLINAQPVIHQRAHQNFMLAEKGIIKHLQGSNKEALGLLLPLKEWFSKNQQSYQALLYKYIGDVYKGTKEYEKSKKYYSEALEYINRYNRHLNYKPVLYQKLSEIFELQNQYNEAYNYLNKAKKLNEELYGSRSLQNRHLLEIKDAFRVKKVQQEQDLASQKLIQLEQQKKLSFYKILTLLGILITICSVGFLLFRNQRIRHKMENELMAKQSEQEIEKQKELLELKNKELTANALQIIAKDEFLEQLQDKLSEEGTTINKKVLLQMIKAEQARPSTNWAMFEAQFTAVNNSFFTTLKEKFPKLSQTELRLCALIKLTFSSKDMAKLLGISVESVHTARYRLRKKLGLNREDNLTEFISNF